MRAILQRVSRASVSVNGQVTGSIGGGLLVLLGIARSDTRKEADYLVDKIIGLRIFADAQAKMNLDLRDSGGALLVVPQFTLYGDCRKGRRPSFDQAAEPHTAHSLYDYFVETARGRGVSVSTGVFQASMQVFLVNDGPVTLIVDSP